MSRFVASVLSVLLCSASYGESATPGPSFSHEGLFRLMQAEFSLSRNQPDNALAPYREEARATGDQQVIERALQIANFLQNSEAGLELAGLLSRLRPETASVWYQTAYHALRLQQPDAAMNAIGKLIALNPEAELEALFLSAYPSSPEGRTALLTALDKLDSQYPKNSHLLFARALLAGENNRFPEAIDYVRRSLALKPDSIPATLLHARLLGLNKQEKDALDVLLNAVMKNPDSRQVNLHYARMLIKTGHPFQAESRIRQMLPKNPNDEELLLMHGLLAFNNKHDGESRSSLEKLVLTGEHADEARYYLALIARRQNNPEQAAGLLNAIGPGPQYVQAMSELSDLLVSDKRLDEARRNLAAARRGQPEQAATLYVVEAELLNKQNLHAEAMELLTTAIAQHPAENLLLFSRALTADRMKNLPGFEKDMQELLARDPGNASYLNALGYTLADRTQRLGEAETYLRQAYRLKPDDPAIIDSMGWLYYRLGNVTEALEYVRKAFTLMQDEEIGTHLAEILWISGNREEAAKIWQQLLDKKPDSDMVLKHKAKFEQKP